MAARPSWIDLEPGLVGTRRELARLYRRAAARPARTLGITLLITAAVVGRSARKLHAYDSRIVFRVTEGELDATTAPPPNRRLQAYVKTVVFSNARLVALMRAHKLRPLALKKDPAQAAEDMREDIGVGVWRNYFLDARGMFDPARSARLSISYADKDPQLAFDVVRDLGQLVQESEGSARVAEAERAAALAAEGLKAARDDLTQAQVQIAAKELALSTAAPEDRVARQVELVNLRAGLLSLEARQERLASARAQLDLRANIERHQLGLQFELVDGGRPAPIQHPHPFRLGLLLFLILLPLVGIAVGAFNSRVYDLEDVRRLGIEPLGQLPAFPGDDVGALEARLRRDHGVK
jgi:hypothetical protein